MVKVSSLTDMDDSSSAKRSVHSVIEQRSMTVVYQPIVDHVQNRVLGYEALTRPMVDGHVIRPDRWFRAAYDCQRSVEADLLALACIFETTASLTVKTDSTPIFANVMPSSLEESAFLKGLEYMIDQGVCQPEQLVLEIIEYVDYEPQSLSRVICTLRSFGIRIALDDFGIGGAHHEAVSALEPDFVKIDRSLIQGISKSVSMQSRLTNLIQRMQTKNFDVICEGIETTDDLLTVREAGFTCSQGYYWGRPLSYIQLPHLILNIESERQKLVDIVQLKNGVLTAPEVVRKSQAIDRLIVEYHKLNGPK